MVKDHAMMASELAPELGFDRLLLGREECADRVIHQVEEQARPLNPIAQLVQELKRADRFVKHAIPTLRVRLG